MATQRTRKAARKNDPEGLRRRLLEAACAAFSTRGYHATSIHQLKREVGATGGALAHHFQTKRDLGIAVLGECVSELVEETWIRPVLRAPTAKKGILDVFATIIAQLKMQGTVSGCPLNNLTLELARHDPEFRRLIDAIFTRWRNTIADKVRADQRATGLRSIDPEGFAALVVATYSGGMAMSKASQSAAPLEACSKQLAKAMRDWQVS